ncbi:MAG: carboxypeptidase-like regulatory domain-containing protein, partial [Chitinophagia bacterium]|nr:carboxypeptidase-like regulatory domain-containing protein [Chitinophagia bacterium]
MNKLSIFLFLFLYATQLFSQVNGTVTNENSEGLSYVNVFVKNTSTGTTTNLDGYYSLKLEPGNYTIVYQFIGYKSQERSVRIGTEAYTENVQLQTASYEMPQVTIEANAEDPAYAIIRKAQSRRKFHLRQNENYECDAYMRGFNKIFDAPEKIMGIDVGDLDETLDSTRQGVIYLSESVSHLYVAKGRSKEVMFSSKVSGNNQGYSFNSAQEMDFNFYNNSLELNRHIISPIGSNAMSIYNYKLEGATIDENGQLVNKIKVTPKNSFDPAFSGFIYINEDLWNINSLELSVTKEASQIPFIDTLKFKISYIPLEQNRWLPISNVINFRMSAFGFELGGNFACVYSNYKLDDVDASIRRDFDGRVDVIPVSDPNSSTMAQRILQYQSALQLSQMQPQLYNHEALHRQMLEVLGIQDAENIVPIKEEEAIPTDPVTENQKILNLEPVKAFPFQDHSAHIQVHMNAMQDPKVQQVLEKSPTAQLSMAEAMSHITE